ncbi:AAA family ATPase [Sporosarcina limicola]|uniref:Flagellar biosynthesis protein FlhG n=1 Tax=Sporosarcina limicola TaxID=34101 RepID=A0A927MEU8_9BACL|nr:AAA family ATPase [Sporosarcina limicola]MBE1553444.1 flagellar biosynthesis protein FlhG [Sporosarcina limicola]
MRDQAETLRLKMLKSQGELSKTIAIASGKGGSGKSYFTTNFAYALRAQSKKVIIIDMNVGMGNIHILLGMTPRYSLKDYLLGTKAIDEVINKAPEGLTFISGGSDLATIMEWSEEMFKRFTQALECLQKEYDFILFDIGATQQPLELIVAVDEIIVILTKEQTSVTDAYSMMKFICVEDQDKALFIVGNRSDDGNDTVMRLQYAVSKFLDKEMIILGYLPEDSYVHNAVVAQRPLLFLFPEAPISKIIMVIAETFIRGNADQEQKKGDGFISKLRNMFTKGRG